jgi:hypothetical protein
MTDLTRPDANRLRKILSGIMNFAKFRLVNVSMSCSVVESKVEEHVTDQAEKVGLPSILLCKTGYKARSNGQSMLFLLVQLTVTVIRCGQQTGLY